MGIGAMGTVMAQMLATNGTSVAILGRTEEPVGEVFSGGENRAYLPGARLSQRITPTNDPNVAFLRSDLVVSAIPCQYLRSAWELWGRYVPPTVPIVSVTKGLEIGSARRPSEIIRGFAPAQPLAVLSGPNIAYELARCLPATAVVASDDADAAGLCQRALSTSWFRVYTSRDVLGVELAGAVKNIIALAAGILDGLRAGDNAKAALVTRGLVEIARLGVALGARPETFSGLAGVGDLITTSVSPHGRNRTAGERIGRGETPAIVQKDTRGVIEGIPTTRAVIELAKTHGVNMPITQAVYDVVFAGKTPIAAITELMQRPPKAEDSAMAGVCD
jgi:glycerol-3-phosphate dehydrogenase (NAD(P)+)